MVEHESERIAEFSDRVIVLGNGTVQMAASPADVFSKVGEMRGLGLSIPQVSELAHLLNLRNNTDYVFTQLEEAYSELTASDNLVRRVAG